MTCAFRVALHMKSIILLYSYDHIKMEKIAQVMKKVLDAKIKYNIHSQLDIHMKL